MQTDFLVIGQGISGTWLSYYLSKEQQSFLVIDRADTTAASRVAAGLINPVTGRRYATTWMAETVLPFAAAAYDDLGAELGIKAFSEKSMIDFFPTVQMRQAFLQRTEENTHYLGSLPDEQHFNTSFHYELGYGVIQPVYIAHLEQILPAWREQLEKENRLIDAFFDHNKLVISGDSIRYGDITAKKIIFCDGRAGAGNPYFQILPFSPNKGEAITLHITGLDPQYVYKKSMNLVPLAEAGHWWIGSAYEWEFDHEDPTPVFRMRTEELLKEWLKCPFEITGHHAALRPATLERRPFAGMHPQQPLVGILNGMGTKGCSLAPFFARQLVDHLLYNKPITPEADINRFTGLLSRQP